MAKQVTRRDFLNGVAIGTGGILLQGYGSGIAASTKVSPGAPATFTPSAHHDALDIDFLKTTAIAIM